MRKTAEKIAAHERMGRGKGHYQIIPSVCFDCRLRVLDKPTELTRQKFVSSAQKKIISLKLIASLGANRPTAASPEILFAKEC